MADSFDVQPEQGYQYTNAYRISSPARRKQINRYKKEFDISDDHMYLLLLRNELDAVDKETIDKADNIARIILVVGVLLFFGSVQTALAGEGVNRLFGIVLSLASFCMVATVYYTGVLNPYKRADRKLKKLMKDLPEVPDLEEWCLQNPAREDVKAQKSYNRKRRRQ